MELTKESFILVAAVCTAIGTIIGTLVASIASFGTAWLNKRSEERKARRDLIFKAALEYWKIDVEKNMSSLPLEHYIIQLEAFYSAFIDTKNTPSNFGQRIKTFQTAISEIQAKKEQPKD